MDGETRSSAPANGQTVHWVIALLLGIIAACLVMRLDGGWLPEARAQTTRVGARGIFALTGQLGPRTHGLFMVDVDAGNVWCYEYSREMGKLRLVAARSFLHDRYLEEFNVAPPTPSEVAQLVKRMRRRQTGADAKGGMGQNE